MISVHREFILNAGEIHFSGAEYAIPSHSCFRVTLELLSNYFILVYLHRFISSLLCSASLVISQAPIIHSQCLINISWVYRDSNL